MAYVNGDPARQALVEQKVRDWDSYTAELKELKNNNTLGSPRGQERTTTVTEEQQSTSGIGQVGDAY